MWKTSIAERLKHSKLMLAGLRANTGRMAVRGISEDVIVAYEQVLSESLTLDNEHEAAKARMKEKTSEFHAKMDQMESYYRNARKMVKAEMPQESWKEFGIFDER